MKQYTVSYINRNNEIEKKHFENLEFAKTAAEKYNGTISERTYVATVKAYQTQGDAQNDKIRIEIKHTDGSVDSLRGLSDEEAKKICNEYQEKGYELHKNMITRLWDMTAEEKMAVAENLR